MALSAKEEWKGEKQLDIGKEGHARYKRSKKQHRGGKEDRGISKTIMEPVLEEELNLSLATTKDGGGKRSGNDMNRVGRIKKESLG